MTGSPQLNWNWVGRYVAVIVLALALGAAIGAMPLFAKTFLVSGKLNAAQLVRFLGYGTALIVFWILGQRLTIALRQQQPGGRWTSLHSLILPVITLIVVSALYSVILLVIGSLLGGTLHKIYDWLFILAIIACAIWLIMAVLGQADALTEALTGSARRVELPVVCAACGASNEARATYCGQCGKKLPRESV